MEQQYELYRRPAYGSVDPSTHYLLDHGSLAWCEGSRRRLTVEPGVRHEITPVASRRDSDVAPWTPPPPDATEVYEGRTYEYRLDTAGPAPYLLVDVAGPAGAVVYDACCPIGDDGMVRSGAIWTVDADGDLDVDTAGDQCWPNPFERDGCWPEPPADMLAALTRANE